VAVFNQTPSGWTRVQTLLAPVSGVEFGRTITFRDGIVVVGSRAGRQLRPLAEHDQYDARDRLASWPRPALQRPRYSGTGAAYVFKRNSLGNWAQTQKLEPVEPAFGFGVSVAIDQGMIIAGAPGDDLGTEFDTPDFHWAGGGAYVYLPVAGRYPETFRLRSTVEQKFAFVEFGFQVAMFGSNIAITAVEPYGFIDAFPRGFVFVYQRDGSSLPLLKGIGDSHLSSSSMALFNNLLMIGTIGDARCIFGCPGSVILFHVDQLTQ
jgi:hypothetical protein